MSTISGKKTWGRITAPIARGSDNTPSVVVSSIRRIDELCEKKRERDILAGRLRSIRQEHDIYSQRVKNVAVKLDLAEARDENEDANPLIREIYRRLQAEQSADGKRELLTRELSGVRATLKTNIDQAAHSAVILEQLCSEAGVEDAASLPDYEQQAQECQRLQNSLREVETQLTLLAGDMDIEKFIELANSQDPGLIEQQISTQQTKLQELKDQLLAVQREIGSLQHEMESIHGGSRAAEINQSIQFLSGKLETDVHEYARLRIATVILRRAIDHYREQNQNPVLSIAEGMFSRLTCGEYASLKVDYDAKGRSILFGVRSKPRDDAAPSDVPVPSMSTGTVDSLYLSLRLASLQHQMKSWRSRPCGH